MSYAEQQAAAASIGERADAEITDLGGRLEASQAALATSQQRQDAAEQAELAAGRVADQAVAARDQAISAQKTALQQLTDAQRSLVASQQAVAARDVVIVQLRADIARLSPKPVEPVEPTVAGAKSVTAIAGTTLSEKNASTAKGTPVTLPAGVFTDRDFRRPANSPTFGHFLHNFGALYGSGQAATVITLEPQSLDFTNVTDAEKRLRPRIESIVEPATCPYYLVRVDAAGTVQDLTIQGTPQGIDPKTGVEYSYHGLMFFGTVNPTLRRVTMRHIPGSRGVPPNETFPLYFYKTSGLITLEDVLIDGDGVGSSGVSGQPAAGAELSVLLNRVRSIGGPNGAGWTCFNRAFKTIRLIDHKTDGSLVGCNFEQVVVNGGNAAGNLRQGEGIRVVRPDYRNPGAKPGSFQAGVYWHLAVDSSAGGGSNGKSVPGVSNRVDVYDPVLPAGTPFWVCISNDYGYQDVPKGAQAQRGADVHLWTGGRWEGDPATDSAVYVGGTERPDLIKLTRSQGAGLG